MIQLRLPTQGELQAIETELRLTLAAGRKLPKRVREAKSPAEADAEWKNEAVRYFYLCVRRGIDPLKTDREIYRMLAEEYEKGDDEDGPDLIESAH